MKTRIRSKNGITFLLGICLICGSFAFFAQSNIKSNAKGMLEPINNNDFDVINQVPNRAGSIYWNPGGNAICTAAAAQNAADFASDGAGGTIIVWEDYRGGVLNDLYAQRISSEGVAQWALEGVLLCNASSNQKTPDIISDGVGGAFIAWYDFRAGNWDIYAQHINSAGVAQWTNNGIAICNVPTTESAPQIASDGLGGIYILWTDMRVGGGYCDLYAQRINSAGVAQWAPNGTAICTAIGNQYDTQIISDGANGAIMTWRDFRSGLGGNIYAQRINSTDVDLWGANGTAICTSTYEEFEVQVVSDESYGAIIVWYETRNGLYGAFAQRINALGVTQWAANGTAVCNLITSISKPVLTKDGEGGAFITWYDNRSGILDIYAQKINSAGIGQWTPNGTAICTAINAQSDARVINDGRGGAIITWTDNRNGNYDVYAQRISAAGVVQWTLDGISVCSEINAQNTPQIISDQDGGAIIIWYDWRSGAGVDIYTRRINDPPLSNHPANVVTTPSVSEQIDWILTDEVGAGMYRIVATDRFGNPYLFIDWQLWINNTALSINVSTTTSGIYTYVMEFYDNLGIFGLLDTVLVIVNSAPTVNSPDDISTLSTGCETINWIIIDDVGSGQYRVLVNDSYGNYYVWRDWAPWINNTVLNIPINRTNAGTFIFTIEYYDSQGSVGIPNSVMITITIAPPANGTCDEVVKSSLIEQLKTPLNLTLIIIALMSIITASGLFASNNSYKKKLKNEEDKEIKFK